MEDYRSCSLWFAGLPGDLSPRPSLEVGLDHATGDAWAGAYVGDGVSTTNLAGRTLCDLIRGEDTPPPRLPWVNHRSKAWEPEPLRWIGVNLALRMMASADKVEEAKGRPARRADLIAKLIGA